MKHVKEWVAVGLAGAIMLAGVSANLLPKEPAEGSGYTSETVRVKLYATGNGVHAAVSWTGPDGAESYAGGLPLMNTAGSQGVSFDVPAGTPVSIRVSNLDSPGGTNLGFEGKIGCRIEIDGYPVASEFASGYDAALTCSTTADYTLGSR